MFTSELDGAVSDFGLSLGLSLPLAFDDAISVSISLGTNHFGPHRFIFTDGLLDIELINTHSKFLLHIWLWVLGVHAKVGIFGNLLPGLRRESAGLLVILSILVFLISSESLFHQELVSLVLVVFDSEELIDHMAISSLDCPGDTVRIHQGTFVLSYDSLSLGKSSCLGGFFMEHFSLRLEVGRSGHRTSNSDLSLTGRITVTLELERDLINTLEDIQDHFLVEVSKRFGLKTDVDRVGSSWKKLTLGWHSLEATSLREAEVKWQIIITICHRQRKVSSIISGALSKMKLLLRDLDIRVAGTSHHLNF